MATHRVDIWSLGCVTLEACVWIVHGKKGLQEFRDRRHRENEATKSSAGDCFHDGERPNPNVLHCVEKAIKHLGLDRRVSDHIVESILDEVGRMLRPFQKERPLASDVRASMENALTGAEAALAAQRQSLHSGRSMSRRRPSLVSRTGATPCYITPPHDRLPMPWTSPRYATTPQPQDVGQDFSDEPVPFSTSPQSTQGFDDLDYEGSSSSLSKVGRRRPPSLEDLALPAPVSSQQQSKSNMKNREPHRLSGMSIVSPQGETGQNQPETTSPPSKGKERAMTVPPINQPVPPRKVWEPSTLPSRPGGIFQGRGSSEKVQAGPSKSSTGYVRGFDSGACIQSSKQTSQEKRHPATQPTATTPGDAPTSPATATRLNEPRAPKLPRLTLALAQEYMESQSNVFRKIVKGTSLHDEDLLMLLRSRDHVRDYYHPPVTFPMLIEYPALPD